MCMRVILQLRMDNRMSQRHICSPYSVLKLLHAIFDKLLDLVEAVVRSQCPICP